MIKSERGEHMPGFEEIVGHEQIVTHLKSAMKLGKVSHAYILSGEKGCGKKLLADVFAETLQCEKGRHRAWRQLPFLCTGTERQPS